MRNAYKVLVGNLNGGYCLGEPGVYERVIALCIKNIP
jgi:hypothetical protein